MEDSKPAWTRGSLQVPSFHLLAFIAAFAWLQTSLQDVMAAGLQFLSFPDELCGQHAVSGPVLAWGLSRGETPTVSIMALPREHHNGPDASRGRQPSVRGHISRGCPKAKVLRKSQMN